MYKYFAVFDYLFTERKDRIDPLHDQSIDVKDQEYPNYEVVPNYNYEQERYPGFNVILGGGYGFLGSVFIGIPLIRWKYRRLGYREWKLMEIMCLPIFKCAVLSTLVGTGVGALFEVKRIANTELQNSYYNKKVF